MNRIVHKRIIGCLGGMLCLTTVALAQQHELKVWFDSPNPSQENSVWGKDMPLPTAGEGHINGDWEWEHTSLPIGNGSIGANVFGSITTERFTFNEKTLWRGGPNTAKGAEYYWKVNKESAHVLKDIRQAFMEGNQEKVTRLTQDNFNSEVPYEADAEEPFRFGSFTTCGEFRINTGIGESAVSDYSRTLSLDSALVTVQFVSDGIRYRRDFFTSFPDNVMVVRFTSDRKGSQNLNFSYTPNPLSTGKFKVVRKGEFCYTAELDNNRMKYVVRTRAIAKGGKVTVDKEGHIRVEAADEVMFVITTDTDYQILSSTYKCNFLGADNKQ